MFLNVCVHPLIIMLEMERDYCLMLCFMRNRENRRVREINDRL